MKEQVRQAILKVFDVKIAKLIDANPLLLDNTSKKDQNTPIEQSITL